MSASILDKAPAGYTSISQPYMLGNQMVQAYRMAGHEAVVVKSNPGPATPPAPTTAGGIGTAQHSPTTTTPAAGTAAGGAVNPGNIVDYAGTLATDPSKALKPDNPKTSLNESMYMQQHVTGINENAPGTNVNANDPKYGMDANALNQTAAQADQTTPKPAETYNAQTTQGNVAANGQATAQQGQVDPRSIITAPQIDAQGTATGTNADGTTNYTGQALNDFATQDLNAVDPKATTKGQLNQLQADFTGANGEPVIPNWAAGTARAVSRIAAFKGMTGTAATAAMSQALMEASLPIAQQDAQFFQTLTLQNLNNKQASIINKANVLSKMDLANLDARTAAAVQNSKNFMDMDLKNLDNKQQTEIINTQARVQSILEDAKAVNTQRMFTAESQNDMTKFYDNLSSSIDMYNTSQTNDMSKFDATLENNREQFYKDMQYNIDIANAKWRQTVTLTESQQKFDAAAIDVKNMVGISQEQLNKIWDRSDSMLDYLWKSSESALDRKSYLAAITLKGNIDSKAADSAGLGSLFGTVAGKAAESFFAGFDWGF